MADLSDDDLMALAHAIQRPTGWTWWNPTDLMRAAIAADRALNAPQAAPVACRARRKNRFSGEWGAWSDVAPEQVDALKKDIAELSVPDEWEIQPLYAAPQASPVAQAERAGWVLVPVEPTPEMTRAAVVYANGNAVYKNVAAEALKIEEAIYAEVYEAMLAAAPTPDQTKG